MKSQSSKYKINRNTKVFVGILTTGAALTLSFQNCAPSITKFSMPSQVILEKTDILSNPGTEEVQNMCKNLIHQYELTDCGRPVTLADGSIMDRKAWELQKVLAETANDDSLVPVNYSYSFGQKMDDLAEIAHSRSILSKSRDMFVDSSGKDFSIAPFPGYYNGYYKADHTLAKQQYVSGQRCYYSTIKLLDQHPPVSNYFDFLSPARFSAPVPAASYAPLRHVAHYMIYGQVDIQGSMYSNHLRNMAPSFEPTPKKQIINLFVGDLRDSQFALSSEAGKIILVNENWQRGHESLMDAKNMINLADVMANYQTAVNNLSNGYTDPTTGINFSGLDGAKQLLANLCTASISGTILSTQYTPIALDLGQQGIITTSASDGVQFDMTATGVKNQTAWLGGRINKVLSTTLEGKPFQHVVSQDVEDGFLVIPQADGSIKDIKNLFGARTEIHGVQFANGYEALMALANKNCRSNEIKDQFFGPWDGELYESTVKVWVDKNKNGVADAGEIISLREAGVPAISACYTNKFGMKDSYGNETALRSIMVYQKPMVATESDIISFLSDNSESSKSTTAAGLEKRISIDIILKGPGVAPAESVKSQNKEGTVHTM